MTPTEARKTSHFKKGDLRFISDTKFHMNCHQLLVTRHKFTQTQSNILNKNTRAEYKLKLRQNILIANGRNSAISSFLFNFFRQPERKYILLRLEKLPHSKSAIAPAVVIL